jgi:glycosyltransferase involved in cell wall biosynthesis
MIATILRHEGTTGVHTHVRELCRYLEQSGVSPTVITPFSWSRALTVPFFGPRLAIERLSGAASVAWYRHWHEVFLRNALKPHLSGVGSAIIYAQSPEAAQAALQARRSPHQRVVMAVHYQASQADGWVTKGLIRRRGFMFRTIRRLEYEVIPQLDGIVYVCQSARDSLLSWLPEAASVRSAVIPNFIAPVDGSSQLPKLADLVSVGSLDGGKNHRYLLEVLAAANKMGRSLTLEIFGDGPSRKDLLRLAESLGITGQVSLRGIRSDVRKLLPRYRAYVHASHTETLPLAIIEAMAAGLPIVAADVGGVSELCDDGVEARFWQLDDPAEGAKTLLRLLDSERARGGAATAAHLRYQREFHVDVVAPRLLSFLMADTADATDGAELRPELDPPCSVAPHHRVPRSIDFPNKWCSAKAR